MLASAFSLAAAVSVDLSPDRVDLEPWERQQFRVTVSGSGNRDVEWFVNDVRGGNSTYGTISSAGLYRAPGRVPSSNRVSVRAVSLADRGCSAAAQVTIRQPVPVITSLSPAKVNSNLKRKVTVNGREFQRSATILVDGRRVEARYVSTSEMEFEFEPLRNWRRAVDVKVEIPDPGGITSAPMTLAFVSPVKVSVSPAKKTLRAGEIAEFRAVVTGAADQTVTWYVNQVKSGNRDLGTIRPDGRYTAPATPPERPVTIRAVSDFDPTAYGTAAVTLRNPGPQ